MAKKEGSKKEVEKKAKITKEEVILNEETPKKKVNKSDQKVLDVVATIFLVLFKIIAVTSIVSLAPFLIFFLITEGISIYLLINGAPYLSFIVTSTGCLLILISLIYIFVKLTINGNVRPSIVLITFFLGLFLSALGSVLVPRDFLKCKFVNGLPDGYKYVTEKYEISNDKSLDLMYFYDFKEDNSLKDNYELEVKRTKGLYKFEVNPDNTSDSVEISYNFYASLKDIKKLSKTVYNDFLKAEYHNYALLFLPKMKITANEEKLNEIKNHNNDLIQIKDEVENSFNEE